MHAGVQHGAQRRGEAGRNAGGAAGEAGEPHEQHGAHLVGVERLADADGAGQHGAVLEAAISSAGSRVSTAAPRPVVRP